jgi:hypothetical protein
VPYSSLPDPATGSRETVPDNIAHFGSIPHSDTAATGQSADFSFVSYFDFVSRHNFSICRDLLSRIRREISFTFYVFD